MAQLKKREKILLAATCVVSVIFVFNQFVCGAKTESTVIEKKKKTTERQVETQQRDASIDTLRRQRRTEKPSITFANWDRDPFSEAYRLAQLDTTSHDSSDFVLRGVIRKGNESYVLIGDAILKEGQSSGDLKVISIEPEQVICRKGNRLVTLVLSE